MKIWKKQSTEKNPERKIKYKGEGRTRIQVAAIALAARIQSIEVPIIRMAKVTGIQKETIRADIIPVSYTHLTLPTNREV